jgi:hypothetical protein
VHRAKITQLTSHQEAHSCSRVTAAALLRCNHQQQQQSGTLLLPKKVKISDISTQTQQVLETHHPSCLQQQH